MTNKEFAEKNAGKYFLCKGVKVRVVGYSASNRVQILVSAPAHARDFGWDALALEAEDVLLIWSLESRYQYVGECELSLLCETKKF